ncbi:MAG: hypothetical protein ACM3ZQ_07555 [Bacillota bacterium]
MTRNRVYRASRPRQPGISVYHFTEQEGRGSGGRGPTPPLGDTPFSHDHGRDDPQGGSNLVAFLNSLSPGIEVVVQYDCQPASYGCFQGLREGNVLLTNYNGYPGLVRLRAERINAISVF